MSCQFQYCLKIPNEFTAKASSDEAVIVKFLPVGCPLGNAVSKKGYGMITDLFVFKCHVTKNSKTANERPINVQYKPQAIACSSPGCNFCEIDFKQAYQKRLLHCKSFGKSTGQLPPSQPHPQDEFVSVPT